MAVLGGRNLSPHETTGVTVNIRSVRCGQNLGTTKDTNKDNTVVMINPNSNDVTQLWWRVPVQVEGKENIFYFQQGWNKCFMCPDSNSSNLVKTVHGNEFHWAVLPWRGHSIIHPTNCQYSDRCIKMEEEDEPVKLLPWNSDEEEMFMWDIKTP